MRKIKARVIRNIGTEAAWLQKNPLLGDGEMALVRFGSRVRNKIGNGSLTFSQLSYQDADLKIAAATPSFPFVSGEGPAPAGVYMANGSGKYNGNLDVNTDGKLVMLIWDGVSNLQSVVTEMPDNKTIVNDGFDSISATNAGSAKNDKLLNDKIIILENNIPDVAAIISGKDVNNLFPDANLTVRRYTSDTVFTDYAAGFNQTAVGDGLKISIPSSGTEGIFYWINTSLLVQNFRVNIKIDDLTASGVRVGVGYKTSLGNYIGFHLSSSGQLSRIDKFTSTSLATSLTNYIVGDTISFLVKGVTLELYRNNVLFHTRTINNDDFVGELCIVQRSFPKYIFNANYKIDPVGDRIEPEIIRVDDLYLKNTLTNNKIAQVESQMNKVFLPEVLNLSPNNRAIRVSNGTTVNPTTSEDATAMLDFENVTPGETVYISGLFSLSYGVCGYQADETFSRVLMAQNAGAVVNIAIANDTPLVVPAGVFLLKGCTLNKTDHPFIIKRYKDLNDVLGNQDNLTQDHLIFEKIDDLSFNLHSYYASKNKYLKHTFVRDIKINTVASGPNNFPNVLTNDVWREAEVFDYNQRIAQGSINFIHRNLWNLNENTHIGSNHGCEVQKWTKLFIDGRYIDFTTIDAGEKIRCSKFVIMFKADIYACNASISIDSDNALPKMNLDGTPVIADSHYLNAVYSADHKTIYRNTLIVGRDNTKYGALYATMQSCYRPHFNMVQITNNDSSLNQHEVVDGVLTVTPLQSDINLRTTTRGYADTVEQWGPQYKIKSRIINQEYSRQSKVNYHCYFGYPSPNWLKVYLMPDICTDNPENTTSLARIFNKGERIDVVVEREIML